MNRDYIENCKGQANSIEWICEMVERHEIDASGAIADYGCGPGTSTPRPLVHAPLTCGPLYLVDLQSDPVLWEQAFQKVASFTFGIKKSFNCVLVILRIKSPFE